MLHRPQGSSVTQWDAQKVRRALVEAYRVLSASEGRVGHRRLRGFWPEHAIEFGDETGQHAAGTFKKARMPRLRPNSYQIARMELVLCGGLVNGVRTRPWLNGIVQSYPRGRRVLTLAVMAQAHRYSFRQLCEGMKWQNRTTRRRERDRAARIIADELNRLGVAAWC